MSNYKRDPSHALTAKRNVEMPEDWASTSREGMEIVRHCSNVREAAIPLNRKPRERTMKEHARGEDDGDLKKMPNLPKSRDGDEFRPPQEDV